MLAKELRELELKMISAWDSILSKRIEFIPKEVILCEYNTKYAIYIIDNTKYKLTKKDIIILEDYNA